MLCFRIVCLLCFTALAFGLKKERNSISTKKLQEYGDDTLEHEVDYLLKRGNEPAPDKDQEAGSFKKQKYFSKLRNVAGRMTDQKYTSILNVTNGGEWGVWGEAEFCEEGSYAVGYDLKIEPYQDAADDTGLNGIKLLCEYPNGGYGGSPTSTVGIWGDWLGQSTCGSNRVLTSFILQAEKYRLPLEDDTAANFVELTCRDLGGFINESVFAILPGFAFFGEYGNWSDSCPAGEGICGLKTKVHAFCASCDDTALNDVEFYCCNW